MNNDLVPIEEEFTVTLSSKDGLQLNGDYLSNIRFDFELSFINRNIHTQCCLYQFTSPNSIYNINETNNKLYIKIGESLIYTEYTIPVGNYNIRTFVTALGNVLGQDYTITVNSVTNKITLYNYANHYIIGSASTIYDIMGFDRDTEYESEERYLTFPYQTNFNGNNLINVYLDNINTNNIDSFSKSKSSLVSSIPINPDVPYIHYNAGDFHFNIYNPSLDYIDVAIRDNDRNFVNFNGKNWTLILKFRNTVDKDRFAYTNTFQSIMTKKKFSTPRI
jgi:hypothetical protein